MFPSPVEYSTGSVNRPVFITGAPRCGSSWVGEILGNCKQTRYVYEPLNFQWMPVLRDQIRHFRYFSCRSQVPLVLLQVADNAVHGRQNWKQLLRAARRGYLGPACHSASRVVIKDPTASLMAEWMAERFGVQLLIVMRHPCGFASSIEALGWPLNVNMLLRQKELMSDHLEPFRGVLNRAKSDKWLTRGAIWGAIHTVFSQQLVQHPEWHLIRYEDLCTDPAGQFGSLAERFGLELNSPTLKKIKLLSATGSNDPGSTRRDSRLMPDIWRRRMSPGEIDAVMGVVAEFQLEYYL